MYIIIIINIINMWRTNIVVSAATTSTVSDPSKLISGTVYIFFQKDA